MDNLFLTPVTSEIFMNILPYFGDISDDDMDIFEKLHHFYILLIQVDKDDCFVCIFTDKGHSDYEYPNVIPIGTTSIPVDYEYKNVDFFDRAWVGTARLTDHMILIDSIEQIGVKRNSLGVIDIQKTGEMAHDYYIKDKCISTDSLFGHFAFVS